MLVGKQCFLRALEDHDVELLRQWRNHPELMQYHCSTFPVSQVEQRQWYESYASDRKHHVFMIENADHVPMGYALIRNLDLKNRKAEIGLHLEPSYQGQGYGKDAFLTLIRFCFQELNLHRLFLEVFDFNEKAIRMYENIGFKIEGRYREAYYTQNAYCDLIAMSLLENEFSE